MCDDHNDAALAGTIESLLKILSKDRAFAMKSKQQNVCTENDNNRKKRRKKKMQNFIMRDYLSDSGEGGDRESIHSRSFSDLTARPNSSTASNID
ncbi:hypothetical protein OESDEN_20723 [Oesophagostomum dentatum]|uniref:Uncharacterized protein n=1 Tax=Oesophagostomum dentatum TaxID=61180 RepID=A0A0B1S6Y7_OESDE|nr:hypothetical protein OESDEN_20723 [Oesophagostomum dentatum]